MAMVGEVVAERYELEELVGTGGMSSVYRARDRQLDRNVALKILHEHHLEDDEHVERFRHEARAVARLSHPNIVTVIDRGESDDGSQFIVFEFVDGDNLKELIEREGPLPVDEALRLAIGVARGLAFAHAEGLIHRDVKPQNVMISADGRPQVTDFGIARSLDIERGVTQTGTVLGTSNYIAPEQASGEHVDACSDIYSLGVVLFELLTGALPFEGENFVAIAMRHINEPAPDVRAFRRDVPLRVAAAVDRALEKDPRRRFPSMDAFAAELEAARRDAKNGVADTTRTVATKSVNTRGPARRRSLPSAVPLAVALLALLALVVIAGAFLALHGTLGTTLKNAAGGGGDGSPVPLAAQASYDPFGNDKVENPQLVRDAVDGNQKTFWTTVNYTSQNFGGLKPGVGIVLATPSPKALKSLTITTDTPGFTAQIKASDSPTGGFQPVSSSQTVESSTTFHLNGGPHSYYLVWLTSLPRGSSSAHVNEVTAKG
ncbi:MAG: serine/threonine-protein kinase [Gaiellaceae bacterium]